MTSSEMSRRWSSSRACAVHRPPVEEAEAARLAAEKNVLGDGAVRHQVDLLVDGADAGALGGMRRPEVDRLPIEDHLAAVAPVRPGQDADEGALAGAVLADKGVNLPSPNP